MKYRIIIDPSIDEEITVYARERTDTLAKIEKLLSSERTELIGYKDDEIVPLNSKEIVCFFVEAGKVFACTEHNKYALKERLYTLEERFPDFMKINQSCLVRVDKIKRFDTTIGGALTVVLEGGYKDYISRRQLKTVKERIGF